MVGIGFKKTQIKYYSSAMDIHGTDEMRCAMGGRGEACVYWPMFTFKSCISNVTRMVSIERPSDTPGVASSARGEMLAAGFGGPVEDGGGRGIKLPGFSDG